MNEAAILAARRNLKEISKVGVGWGWMVAGETVVCICPCNLGNGLVPKAVRAWCRSDIERG
jgi:hypothetical protein